MKATVKEKKSSVFSLLKPYRGMIYLLIFLALLSNGVNLLLPKLIANGIDAYTAGTFLIKPVLIEFSGAIVLIFIFTYLQSVLQKT